ncbi:hypothetical protein [Neptunomonas phycophila]|uniref:hypothetical protein n=1 Tax=Neptunomonas phycophila TaxID=1572645 RepID=UPI000948E032|nr:hypothetical protein [Neptunomonas phycophila]
MNVTGWSLKCIFKWLLIFMLFLQLFFVVTFLVGREAFSKYVPIENMSVKQKASGYLIQISDVEFVDRDIHLMVVGASNELRHGREDRGVINTRIICNGRTVAKQTRRLNGKYGYTKDAVYVGLIEKVTAHKCAVEMTLDSKEFSELISSMTIVRTKDGEMFGVDLRNAPVILTVSNICFYFSIWYLSFLHGAPAFVGLAMTLITTAFYFYFKRNEI